MENDKTALVAAAAQRLESMATATANTASSGLRAQACSSAYGNGWSWDYINCPGTSFTYSVTVHDVHFFTGAPKSEAKSVPCGRAVTEKSRNGFKLTGLQASTDINEVTCLGCLRALISKK